MHLAQRSAVQPLLRKALLSASILSAERERELLMRYHEDQDKLAMDELVRSHMPIIFRVAGRSAQNPGVDINDLVQTATEGLLIAINRWSFEKSDASGARYAQSASRPDEKQGLEAGEADATMTAIELPHALPRASRLATYAMWWMRILLTDTVIEHRGMIARVKGQKVRKALFALPAAIRDLDISLPLAGSDVSRIASHLGVSEKIIEEALIHAAGDVMLDEPVGDGSVLRGDLLPDHRAEGEDGVLNRLADRDRWAGICRALISLPPRDRFILITRNLISPKWKLDRLSETLEMSRERLRQIGDDGLSRIKRMVGTAGVRHNPENESAIAQIEALVHAIEVASQATAKELAGFLTAEKIAIGPTRTVRRPAIA